MKTMIFTTLLALSASAFAGDAAKLTHLGFSADGSQYAFMQSGVQDGSGMAYANIRFLDVVKNDFSASGVNFRETEESPTSPAPTSIAATAEAQALKAAAATLKKLGISAANKGDVVISRKLTDIEASKLKTATFMTNEHGTEKFKVTLTESTAATSAEHYCMDTGAAKKMKLTVTDLQTNTVKTLQEDKILPKARGCVYGYAIEDVVLFQDATATDSSKVVVLLRTASNGFEGPDYRFMVVSGSLK